MKLYHGSDMVVRGPLANVGRAKVDFGQGFYLTKLRGQAYISGMLSLLN